MNLIALTLDYSYVYYCCSTARVGEYLVQACSSTMSKVGNNKQANYSRAMGWCLCCIALVLAALYCFAAVSYHTSVHAQTIAAPLASSSSKLAISCRSLEACSSAFPASSWSFAMKCLVACPSVPEILRRLRLTPGVNAEQ